MSDYSIAQQEQEDRMKALLGDELWEWLEEYDANLRDTKEGCRCPGDAG